MSEDIDATRRLRVDHEAGDRFRIAIRQHTLWVDQPEADGGEDTAPNQVELFVASLASCVAFNARRFLSRHGLSVEGLSVTAEFGMASHPARVGEVTLRLRVPAGLAPAQEAALRAVASHCTVHNTLLQPPPVRFEVVALAAGAA
jgi:uncharacterized OsmC-like protein